MKPTINLFEPFFSATSLLRRQGNLWLILPLFLLFSCQPEVNSDEIPESLKDKRELLRGKQADFKKLGDEIEALELAIIEQDPNSKKRGALVTVTKVNRTDFQRFVALQGSVAAEDFYEATSETPGRILSLSVKEGDQVRKGQLIATIDVESLQKQRSELETSLELAQTIYDRQDRLWKQKIGSEMQFLQAKNNKERLDKSLASLDVQLAKNKVYSPSNGVVERVVLQSGELASPGMPIVLVLNTAQLKVVADVPENYIKSIKRGDRVEVEVLALNMKKTLPVSLIGKTVDPANRTFKVEVKLPADPYLKPNLLAEMMLKDFEAKGVLTAPLDRIQQEVGGDRFVFITAQGEDGLVAQKKYVEIGNSYDGEVIITKGLKGGETLVLEGSRNLTDGQLIEVMTEKLGNNE